MNEIARTDEQSTAVGPVRPIRSMMIKGLMPSLPERGRVKIGVKGLMRKSSGGKEFQPPQKLDHFLITTMERGADNNFVKDAAVHAKVGDKPTEIPVRLLYDDPALNFPTRYAAFTGRKLWCTGDGENALRLARDGKGHDCVQCPCHRKEPDYDGPDKCKMNGVLSVIIDGAGGIGGVWKFRTTSYNSIVGLLSSMTFIKGVTGGVLANIPLKLTVRPKQATDPKGQQQTIYVVGLEFNGDMEELQAKGHEIALGRATTHVSIQHIEDEARRLLSFVPANVPLPGDDPDDIVDEFYPEQNQGDGTARPSREDFADGQTVEGGAAEPEPEDYDLVDEVGEIVQTTDFHKFADAMLNRIIQFTDAAALAQFMENNAANVERLKGVTDAYQYILDDAANMTKRLQRPKPEEAAPVGPDETKPAAEDDSFPGDRPSKSEPTPPPAKPEPQTKAAVPEPKWIENFRKSVTDARDINAVDHAVSVKFKAALASLAGRDPEKAEDLFKLAADRKLAINNGG